MTVLENMLLAAPRHPGEQVWRLVATPRAGRRRERELRGRALELLRLVRLDGLAGDYAGTLSGGQRKLLELTRALMTEPRVLLLDEPMAGVNPTLGHRLLDYLQRLREERGLTVLFVEHDMDVVMGVSDEVIVMAEGQVISRGAPERVRTDPRVIDAYLGAEPAHA
jgi:neutral amino acid transport system ATP-binding protein